MLRNFLLTTNATYMPTYLLTPMDLQGLKEIIFLEIGLKCTISDYNEGHIIWELHTWDVPLLQKRHLH